MPISQALQTFQVKAAQCDALIASAHRSDANGQPFFSQSDREQITVAAFLNFFVAWEEFLESAIARFLVGAPTLSGGVPVKFASPPSEDIARAMLIGPAKYFDYADHGRVLHSTKIFFDNGYPFNQNISSIASDLGDMKVMRNAAAHFSSTTRAALEALAQRILSTPQSGITLYGLLTSVDPRDDRGSTVFATARDKLLVAAGLIAQG